MSDGERIPAALEDHSDDGRIPVALEKQRVRRLVLREEYR